MNNTDHTIAAVITMAGLVIITFLTLGPIGQNLRNQAVDSCQKNSLVVWKDGTRQGTNFVPEWFAQCMQKKNYK